MGRPTAPCSGVWASCSPCTVRGSTPRISARTTLGSPGPASVASRARGCSARRRPRWGSTSAARRSWATAPATSSRPAPAGGAASWWRRARGARRSRRRASSARPSCATSLRPLTRLCGRPSGRRFRFVTAVRRPALLLVAVALGTRGLAGQTPLRIGQSVTGRLTLADRQLADSSRYKLYTFDARLGDTVSADMSSDDLDANLILADASGNPLARNDDAGGGCNAHLSFVMPAAGTYELFANSSSQGGRGDSPVGLGGGGTAAGRATTCRGFGRVKGVIQVGQTVKGQLTSGDQLWRADTSYNQRWVLPLEAGRTVTVDLASDDFDSYLLVTRGRGQKLVENDDGGGGCNARVVYAATDDHPVRLVVNSAGKLQTGHFTLRVADGARPPEPKGSCRFRALRQQAEARAVTAAGAHEIRVGQTLPGQLTTSDSLYPDTTYYQFWQFSPRARQQVTIDLASDEFDPVLILRGLDTTVVNHHGGPGCNARVSLAFPETGPYTILVNTSSEPPRQTGRFTLSLSEGHKDRVSDECRPPRPSRPAAPADGQKAHTIAVGQSLEGVLTGSDHFRPRDSTYSQSWTIAGTAGQVVTGALGAATFAPSLFVGGRGIATSLQDDDSGGNCNARLTLTFAQTGDYVIVVNSSTKHGTGPFNLSVTKGAKAKSLTRCDRPS